MPPFPPPVSLVRFSYTILKIYIKTRARRIKALIIVVICIEKDRVRRVKRKGEGRKEK